MQSLEGVNNTKDKILSTLRLKGPCLPVQISKEINFSPLFASAFLSELKGEGKLKISNMRVGSSPLYYLPGQEEMLEKFSGYLNQREKEAYFHLREKRVLDDAEQSPVMRVALRAIKDFAHSVRVNVKGEARLFWKHFSLSDEEVTKFVRSGNRDRVVKKKEEKVSERREEVKSDFSPKMEVQKALEGERRPLAERKRAKVQESEFVINVKDYLSVKEIEVMEVFVEKKREFEAIVRIDTLLGKQEFYLVAKEKKSVSDGDFAMALQKAQGKKMLAAVMSTGELNKRGKEHLEQWGNLVKWERLKF